MVTTVKDGWELVVGLEVHVELNTVTKMWCGCLTDFGDDPNTNVCAVCTGQPGSLPVVNGEAIRSAALIGLAINCSIHEVSRFHRKNYFYPDLVKNYQISQYDVPICFEGHLELEVEANGEKRPVRVGIERLHMEEDTGKSTHLGGSGRLHGADTSLIDYNRAGVPLMEVVSHPDIRDPETAQAYVRELQGIVEALGVSDARMDQGSMRVDANVSVRHPGDELGTRTEIKNLNSVRSVGRAIAHEAARQIAVLEDGGTIRLETRHWDEGRGVTETLRVKESVTDYRYFPDPDLVPVHCPAEWVEELRASLPELPAASRVRLEAAGVDPAQAAALVSTTGMLAVLDGAVADGADARTAANWLVGDIAGQVAAAGTTFADSGITGAHLGELLALVDDGSLSNNLAKQVVEHLVADRGSRTPAEVAEAEGLQQVSDTGELQAIVDRVVADNPDTVATIRDGNAKAIGALVGQVMKATQGQADPRATNELLRASING